MFAVEGPYLRPWEGCTVRNPVLAAAVVSSVLLAGLVAWHTRGGKSDEIPAVNASASAAGAPHRNSLVERGSARRGSPPPASVTADALWVAAGQIQRELHAATTRTERERLLAQLETIVQQMNTLQADGDSAL
jgi:hypothetical protein